MYKDVPLEKVAGKILDQLKNGAFLTVKSGDKVNTMTIGWGTIGYLWHKPICIVMVRPSRYTFSLIEKAKSFTVSFLLEGKMSESLKLCGTNSGRDVDKVEECGISLIPGKAVDTHVIDGCDIYLECAVIYKTPLIPNQIPREVKSRFYDSGDYHTLYFGEILVIRSKESNK